METSLTLTSPGYITRWTAGLLVAVFLVSLNSNVIAQSESGQSFPVPVLEGLSAYMPNLVIGDGELTTAVSIRGVGSQPERSFEQSVGLFVDGIYMPRSRQYRVPFMDIRQVEVLRGPQAVLFGINATAGAITIATNRSEPGDPMLVSVEADYEFEYDTTQLTAVLGGSPTENLGLRLAARYRTCLVLTS